LHLSFCVFISFLLYCYRALRALHSFPTRRSSDLHQQAILHAVLDQDRVLEARQLWRRLTTVDRQHAELHVVHVEGVHLAAAVGRSEEHTSELQSRENLVCRLLLEKKKKEHKHKSL